MDSCSKSLRDSSPFDCLLFDLDETLYPSALGIGQATKRNIDGSHLLLGYDIDADDYHRDCFEKIICFETFNPNLSKSTRPDEFPVVLKPSQEAFRIAIDVAEIDPRRTLFLDDSLRNVAAGKALGLRTAMVGKSGKFKEADYALENINSLAQAIPEIWFGEGENENHRLSGTRSQIEPVLATASVGA
ncbi:hypothetical protein RHGRI_003433 [Rhododendron griersonianum]|uniref:Uncharacterized protein n=1 Tax=Rhododendron griersonianum TaxID=479676 RepID=A0AAV6L5W9_9ERIC|nr:hypothetical protein RHGRI_003433 [Rhododendron griersonianum]